MSRTRCSVLHAASQSRDPDAAAWVPALRRVTSCRAASGIRVFFALFRAPDAEEPNDASPCARYGIAVIVHLHRVGKAAYLGPIRLEAALQGPGLLESQP